jgi:predicted outer membrane protein
MRCFRGIVLGVALFAGTALAQARPDAGEWISELMLVNRWAQDSAQIAAQQATTREVREFAQNVEKSHRDLQRQLELLAQSQNVDPAVALAKPETPGRELINDALVTSLRALPQLDGLNLDRTWLSSVVTSHDLVLDKLGWVLGQANDPKLARSVQPALGTLRAHRQRAWELLGSKELSPVPGRVGQARRAQPARPPAKR